METLAEFAVSIQPKNHMLSFDIEKAFCHFCLHLAKRDWFIFRYDVKCYQCVDLPFGWGCSPLWLTRLMAPFVAKMRSYGYRVLPYMEDFQFVSTSFGIKSGLKGCQSEMDRVDKLLRQPDLRRHMEKGEWKGSPVVDHFGVRVDTM